MSRSTASQLALIRPLSLPRRHDRSISDCRFNKVEEIILSDATQQHRIKFPPNIRRRRQVKGVPGDASAFIKSDGAARGVKFEVETLVFPPKPSGVRLSALTTSPTCLALCFVILNVLMVCAILSHYTSEKPHAEPRGTAMTFSEQQILLKAYLGDLEGSYSASNVKLPAGGNPIDLFYLLNSRIEKEDPSTVELSGAVHIPGLCTPMVFVFLFSIMAEIEC